MLAPARRNPIIPGNPRERTGAGGILRRAGAAIRARFAGLERDAIAAFDAIPILSANDSRPTPTIYMLTPEQLAALSVELQRAVERWIASGREAAQFFWWSGFDAEASQLGAAQSALNLAGLSPAYAATRTLTQIVNSEPYRNRLAAAQIRSLDHWTGLAATVRADLSQVIGRAVVDGKTPRAVRREIAERLDVSKSRALLYAQTDITGTLREARWAEADHARDELGLELALLWTSALLPSTRASHAARHGKVYDTAEVRAFYGRDGNRYRCFLPGTIVAGRFSAGIKSRYQGPAVRLVTAGGRELAVTANHPVLTARGMVPAAEVREGDKLVAYRPQVQAPLRVGNLDGGLMGARAEDVFGALVQLGHQFPARVTPIDLHGDARFCEPDVDVVNADGELVFALDASAAQLLDDLALVCADAPRPGGGPRQALGETDLANARDEVRGRDMRAPFLGTELRHARALPIAAVTYRQPEVSECSNDRGPGNAGSVADRENRLTGNVIGVQRPAPVGGALPHPLVPAEAGALHRLHDGPVAHAKAIRDVLQRFAGLAAFDEVVDVVLFEYRGHVFDLQERSGLMLGSNIVTSNCHCSQTECLIDEDGTPILSASAKRTMAREREVWERRAQAAK